MFAIFYCAVCAEPNETVVDESAGAEQQYTEDCQVCCRPNVLRIKIDEAAGEAEIQASFEE